MTDFVTDLRAKGWNVHDAQQEANVTLGPVDVDVLGISPYC